MSIIYTSLDFHKFSPEIRCESGLLLLFLSDASPPALAHVYRFSGDRDIIYTTHAHYYILIQCIYVYNKNMRRKYQFHVCVYITLYSRFTLDDEKK